MIKTKIAALVIAAMLALSLVGCGATTRDESTTIREVGERFKPASLSMNAYIVTDTETGVQYLYVQHGYGGGLTVLVDEGGNPMIEEQP